METTIPALLVEQAATCCDCSQRFTYLRPPRKGRGGARIRLRCDACEAEHRRARNREHARTSAHLRSRTLHPELSERKATVVCIDCGEPVPTDYRAQGGGGQRKRCDDCTLAKNRRKWRRSLCLKHGITPEQYDALLAAQGGTCAIGGCDRTRDSAGRALHIDHDHDCCPGAFSCGQCIRGLLCDHHNVALGYAHNSPAELRALANYLEE